MAIETTSCHQCGQPLIPGARFCQHCGVDVLGEQVQSGRTPWSGSHKSSQELALDLLRQDTLGEYEILGELGRGGMATVYLAHDLPLDRKVAIKVMSTPMADEGMSERFRREARTAASLTHPHIIPIYAVRDRNPLLFFVMKFIMGQSLDPILKSMGRLPIPMAEMILGQTASALGYAHRRGVIHRDIKPANVMLDDEGWAIVTDFGIAKVSTATGLTMTGVTVGTPAYMSPEQCMGREVTGASDQYSLGVVAYEMLTGQKPFKANTAMAMMYSHLNDSPPPLMDLRPDCPPGLAASVMRLLSKDPAERWPRIDDAFPIPTLSHDDPTRKELVALAMSGANARITARLSVPTSPVPPAKRPAAHTPQDLTTTPLAEVGAQRGFQTDAGTRTSPMMPDAGARGRAGWLPWAGVAAVAGTVLAIGLLRTPSGNRELPAAGAGGPDSAQVSGDSGTTAGAGTTGAALTGADSAGLSTRETPTPQPLARIQLTPARLDLEVGRTARLVPALLAADGSRLDQAGDVAWRSSSSRVASVSSDGVVRGLAAGRATVTASIAGKSASSTVEVSTPAPVTGPPVPIAAISVVPGSGTIQVGGTLTLEARLFDASGSQLTGRQISWSGSGRILSVADDGEVTGISPGAAIVTASSEGRSAAVTITVTAVPVASVALNAPNGPLRPGETFQLTSALRDARGGALTDRSVAWESSDPSVASVANGLVTARTAGTVTITATAEGRSAAIRVTVNPPPPDPAVEQARATQEIGRLLDGFLAALNNRDLAALKRVYPGMSSGETSSWKALLEEKSLSRLQAAIQQTQAPKVNGDEAESQFRLRLTLQFSGRPEERSEIAYRAQFEKGGGAWKLSRLIQQ